LNSDEKSPFFEKIQTPTNPDGKIKDNTILRMLEYSILEGVLYNFRDPKTGDGDVKKMCSIVNNFFGAVRDRFPEDWELTPRKSRLVHGAGIISMGFLMDQIATKSKKGTVTSKSVFATEIELIAGKLRWSSGFWVIPGKGKVQWNDFQNTSKDLSILTSHILDLYAQAKEI
jgi:hypothetical protein